MAVIKCKMCGGDLNITEGLSVAECEYCGSKQTIPNVDNEKKMTLFNRASRLLRGCEFDKAAGIFESIIADFPEEAEAYWGLVLCKYGIEYVDDPATGKKVPTCHRSSFESVLEDSDFEQACELNDSIARKVYRDEAKQIEELRKGIIAVSANEEPYDIFICYKETAEDGDRTLDSVIAQDIYDALTDRGYRVFFSRITLEDKLGIEYEPYIFAALNSAKVMLAVGTEYEHFNAVWVKNEWSRYLKLVAKDKSKHLIPVFKNMDAYDMPKEFAKLAAQDMGRVGAMQDLLRGIEKLLSFSKKEVLTSTGSDADEIANTVTYRTALDTARRDNTKDLKNAIAQLRTISGWKDTDQQIIELEKRLAKQKKKKVIRNTVIIIAILSIVSGLRAMLSRGEPYEAPAALPAEEVAAAPKEAPANYISAEDLRLAEQLLGGSLDYYGTYGQEGAEAFEIRAFTDGAIEITTSGNDNEIKADLDKALLLQINWDDYYNRGSWRVETYIHAEWGYDPDETLMNSVFCMAQHGNVQIKDGTLLFYAENDGLNNNDAEPAFFGELKVDGAETWLNLSGSGYSAVYKLLSE